MSGAYPGFGLVRRVAVVLVCAAAFGAGCSRVSADRAQNQVLAQAAKAIERYSTASEDANTAHKKVMEAFAKANAATTLAEYQERLRNDVIPALNTFVGVLRAMPTETPELKAIHARLVEAYNKASNRIRDFEQKLQDPRGLSEFDAIRKELQDAVAAYKNELNQYYAKNKRQLRFEGRVGGVPESAAPAAPATPASAAASASATSAP